MAKVIRVKERYSGRQGGLQGYEITYTVRGNRHEYAEIFAKDELDAYRMGNALMRREVEAEDTADIEAFRQILKTFPDYPVPKKWRKKL
jgi:cytolysin (calcineurin-like family phosphatase)